MQALWAEETSLNNINYSVHKLLAGSVVFEHIGLELRLGSADRC